MIDSIFSVMVLVLILKTSFSYLFCNVLNHFWANVLGWCGHWWCYYCLPEDNPNRSFGFIVALGQVTVHAWEGLIISCSLLRFGVALLQF